MQPVWIAFAVSFLAGLVLVRALRDLANRFGLYDKVEGGRKLHTRPIPRVGGVAVTAAFLVPLVGLAILGGDVSRELTGDHALVMALLGGGSLIFALGVWDDLLGAPAWFKFGLQILAGLVVCASGIEITGFGLPFLGVFHLGWLAIPATVFWIALITNAVNLIDGMDGLAGGCVALAGATLCVMDLIAGDFVAAAILASMVGAVCAFLVYNVNPASIFLGDAGSLVLGFVLSVLSVHGSQKGYTLYTLMGAVLVLGLPLFDLSMAVVRRALTGKPLFAADQHHVHHLLLRKGLSQRQSVAVLIGGAALLEIVALALIYSNDTMSAIIVTLLAPCIAVVVRALGYPAIIKNGRREAIVARLLEEATERENLVLELRRDLPEIATVDELWVRLQPIAAGLGLERLELEIEPQMLGFSTERKRAWQRSTTPEERGIHLQNLEKTTYPLRVAGRVLGTLKMTFYKELALFAPHDRALHQIVADTAMQGLVQCVVQDSRMVNVLPFRGRAGSGGAAGLSVVEGGE